MDDIAKRKVIAHRLENGETVTLSFKFVNDKILMSLNSILARILAKIDHIYLLNSTVTILREIIVNALKANAKRIFFQKKHLDINNEAEYRKGMNLFKKQIVGDFNRIEEDLLASDFHVRTTFEYDHSMVTIIVTNNSAILPVELERVQFRMQKANQYNDFTEAYSEIEDDTEGAGLGIVLTLLLLKNMGIDSKFCTIEKKGGSTQTTLRIPSQLKPLEITTKIKIQILREIEGIPTFPENLVQLQRLCNNPEAPMEQIVKMIKSDPALSTDVIKLSNSAGIAPYKRIEDIKTAVVTIGMKNLNAIIVASNARRILNERYSSFEAIWEHCNKVAFYARTMAVMLHMTEAVDNVYMAGLLHDLGKIVLLAMDMGLVKKIAHIVNNRKISNSTTMEEISIGISHSTIGALISNKWNFPEYLIETIKYHHSPYTGNKKYRDIIYITYLANMIVGIEDRKYNYFYIDENILEKFELLDQGVFNEFHEKLKITYKNNLYP